uniref:Uncharacterized protein n=1 Tax=Steinernema glaseri TaxID=37863 RepID=A0A1I7Y6B3_9BILA
MKKKLEIRTRSEARLSPSYRPPKTKKVNVNKIDLGDHVARRRRPTGRSGGNIGPEAARVRSGLCFNL